MGLPRMSIGHLRQAAGKFKERTAVGQTGIAPRALSHLSDMGLYVLSALFSQCEKMGEWPTSRLFTALVRLPKD
eukprot:483963-Pyramimonas_sp.AAC.1